jgi:hypothetical protein
MAAEPTPITVRNQEDYDELLSTVAEIAETVGRMEREFHALLSAWQGGGLRGLRAAAGRSNGAVH